MTCRWRLTDTFVIASFCALNSRIKFWYLVLKAAAFTTKRDWSRFSFFTISRRIVFIKRFAPYFFVAFASRRTRRVYVVWSVQRRGLHLVERLLSASHRLSLVAVSGRPLPAGERLPSTVCTPRSQLRNADEARRLRCRRRLLYRRFDTP